MPPSPAIVVFLLSVATAPPADVDRARSDYLRAVAEARKDYLAAAERSASDAAVRRELARFRADPTVRPSVPVEAAMDYGAALDRAEADCRLVFRRAAKDRERLGYPAQGRQLLEDMETFLDDAAAHVIDAQIRIGKRDRRPLRDGQRAIANRAYQWAGVPEDLRDRHYLLVHGGRRGVTLDVMKGGRMLVAVGPDGADALTDDGWRPTGQTFTSTGLRTVEVRVFEKIVEAGPLELSDAAWLGPVPIVP